MHAAHPHFSQQVALSKCLKKEKLQEAVHRHIETEE
jgi:hypothetical protein